MTSESLWLLSDFFSKQLLHNIRLFLLNASKNNQVMGHAVTQPLKYVDGAGWDGMSWLWNHFSRMSWLFVTSNYSKVQRGRDTLTWFVWIQRIISSTTLRADWSMSSLMMDRQWRANACCRASSWTINSPYKYTPMACRTHKHTH